MRLVVVGREFEMSAVGVTCSMSDGKSDVMARSVEGVGTVCDVGRRFAVSHGVTRCWATSGDVTWRDAMSHDVTRSGAMLCDAT